MTTYPKHRLLLVNDDGWIMTEAQDDGEPEENATPFDDPDAPGWTIPIRLSGATWRR